MPARRGGVAEGVREAHALDGLLLDPLSCGGGVMPITS
jgi:hypothetical protein